MNSNVSIAKVKDDFGASNMHIIMMDKNMDAKEKQQMLNKVDKVKRREMDHQYEFTYRA